MAERSRPLPPATRLSLPPCRGTAMLRRRWRRRRPQAELVAAWPALAPRLRASRAVATEEGEELASADGVPDGIAAGSLTCAAA